MEQGNLLSLIQKAAGTFQKEDIYIFIGEVISVNEDENTCVVKSVTSLSTTDTDYVDETIDKNYINSLNKDPNGDPTLIHEDVALMAGGCIDDGLIMIPEIGSHVTVVSSIYQQSFVIQYSAVSSYQFTIDKNKFVLDKSGMVSNTDKSEWSQSDDGFNNSVDGKTTIKQDDTSFEFSVNGESIFKQTSSGFKISNSSSNLKDILGDLISALSVLTVTCAAPGSPSTVPINVADFTAIGVKFNSLFE